MIKVGSDSGNLPLGQIQEKQNNLLEKLASGKKVNNALDDAAAQQIIDRLTSEVEGNRQTLNNVYDGISLAQVAEGGLGSINDDVNRIRTHLQSGSGILRQRSPAFSLKSPSYRKHCSNIEQTNFAGKSLLLDAGSLEFQPARIPISQ